MFLFICDSVKFLRYAKVEGCRLPRDTDDEEKNLVEHHNDENSPEEKLLKT